MYVAILCATCVSETAEDMGFGFTVSLKRWVSRVYRVRFSKLSAPRDVDTALSKNERHTFTVRRSCTHSSTACRETPNPPKLSDRIRRLWAVRSAVLAVTN